jgi:hypothetical protein
MLCTTVGHQIGPIGKWKFSTDNDHHTSGGALHASTVKIEEHKTLLTLRKVPKEKLKQKACLRFSKSFASSVPIPTNNGCK